MEHESFEHKARLASLAARAVEFCILIAVRSGEAIGAHWREIDLKAAVWTIPPGRMKGSREHRVPLVGRALEILTSFPAGARTGFVFEGLVDAMESSCPRRRSPRCLD
jgi:integrase